MKFLKFSLFTIVLILLFDRSVFPESIVSPQETILLIEEVAIEKNDKNRYEQKSKYFLEKLSYNNSTNQYEVENKRIISLIGNEYFHTKIFSINNYIYTWSLNSIRKYDNSFQTIQRIDLGKSATFTKTNDLIFVAAKGYLIAYDKNLNELGRVNLNLDDQKNAHDLIVHGKTIYLLDNIIFPMYIIKVNIENPKHMNVENRFLIKGVNAHLTKQWINQITKEWYVIESYSGMGGGGRELHVFNMYGKIKQIIKKNLLEAYNPELSKKIDIIDITPKVPLWALLNDNNNFFVSKINSENANLSIQKMFPLNNFQPNKIKKIGNNLILFKENGRSFKIYKIDVNDLNEVISYKLPQPKPKRNVMPKRQKILDVECFQN
jgi:hypothetical protein